MLCVSFFLLVKNSPPPKSEESEFYAIYLSHSDAPLATRRFGEEAPPAAALPEEAAAAGTRVGDLLASPALEAEAAAGAGAFLAAAGAVLRLAATVACGEPCWIVVVFVWGGGDLGWLVARERG